MKIELKNINVTLIQWKAFAKIANSSLAVFL